MGDLFVEEEKDLCVICQMPLTSNQIRLNCSHVFHTSCVKDFRSHNEKKWKSCPLCRAQLTCEDVLNLISKSHNCEICTKSFNDSSPAYNLSCGHCFHMMCLITKGNCGKCTVCEEEFPEGTVKNADYNYKVRMGYL